MLKNILCLICLLITIILTGSNLKAQQSAPRLTYRYWLDLTNVKNDRVNVTLITPSVVSDEVVFQMPSIVPGTYSVYNFGRFIHKFKACNQNGKPLEVEKTDENSWKILNAQQLYKIEYQVEDTWDTNQSDLVFEPGGSNIEAGKNFIINSHAFMGFLDGMRDFPFEVNVYHPTDLFGSTALVSRNSTEQTDRYLTKNYQVLADSPIMYTQADTATITLGDTDVLISLYSPNDMLNAEVVATHLNQVLFAQQRYLGGKLPVDRYAFLIYLSDKPSLSGAIGALEHSYSSVYFLPEASEDFLASTIRDIAAHEFFHILTPLGLHSEEISSFDFEHPRMSKHLWLYEGVTEYFAHHVQVQEGLISTDVFFRVIKNKIETAANHYNDSIPFTDLSKYCLDKYADQYGNVYEKGALIAMSLDILLLHKSDGHYSLRDLVLDLIDRYGKDKPFQDDDLFEEIAKISGIPETRPFFANYVEDNQPLPLSEILALAGVDYYKEREVEVYTLGNVDIDLTEEGKLIVTGINELDRFGKKLGYEKDDIILSFNGIDIDADNAGEMIQDFKQNARKGSKLVLKVQRNGKTKKLKSKVKPIKKVRHDVFEPMDRPKRHQQLVFDAWINGLSDDR
ncbi:peptidase M61 [Limibacter armeniacum]|uniref:M61 family metallopeptidase n=1 Tax=Limibacter armeniacum TaxID=466084 RepID=UPI002FE50689